MGTRKRLIIYFLVILLSTGIFFDVLADNPIFPAIDSYTDGSDPDETWDMNFGNELFLQLGASNLAQCVPTTYLWYKFQIPSTTETIATANFSITFETIGATGDMDMELMGSSDNGWTETGITWRNQPALDIGQLATALSVPGGGTAVFSGSTLANHLNSRKGETVTLVVRANCAGTVSSQATRLSSSKENTNGSGAKLELFTPTAITLSAFSASSHISSPWILLLSVGLLVIVAAVAVVLHRRSRMAA